MMVIAGAGSGKTRVLTYKIAHLIQGGVDSFNILSLTFTNKAAKEMKERIEDVVGIEARNIWSGTFHSVFSRILRAESAKIGYPQSFTIYDSQDSVKLIGAIIKEMALDKDDYKAKQILGRISSFKNNLITVKAYMNNAELKESDLMAKRPKIGEIYKNYVDRCFKAGAMDFDDLLLKTNELLVRFPDVLEKYQNRFKYIMVDEYQDTNHSQYLIVKALADKFKNICVVGDDSQSIYAFRGANIQNILNFQKDYENVKVFKLEQNYRSTSNIVNAANTLIEKNKNRIDKEIWTQNEAGSKVKVARTLSDSEEGRYVANSIFENKMNHQLDNDSFAILYRTNAQSRSMEDSLRKKNIPYKVYGGLSFYQRKEIKDLVAYLRLIINPKDEEALKRVINYPARGIGLATMDKINMAANHYKRSMFEVIANLSKIDLKLTSGTRNKLDKFYSLIRFFQAETENSNALEIVKLVLKKTEFIKDIEKEGTPESVSRLENIEELVNGIKDFIDGKKEANEPASLTDFLEDVALATSQDTDEDQPCVSLMTIHLSKGLEYPYVYVVGLEENLFPSALSLNSRPELEEERRLFYVALTRAEKQAYITYAETRYRWGKLTSAESSRFIEEIDDKYIEYMTPRRISRFDEPSVQRNKDEYKREIRIRKPMQRSNLKRMDTISNEANVSEDRTKTKLRVGGLVEHSRFGRGEVLTIEGEGANKKASIKFAKGTKNMLLQFAKLRILGM
ncbi:MAG: UvrD-helicase domain-containing protein [Flavobacteriaceae bacterium]|nr:UvrD-helicase domain-containing protein [Flavobacteriaceae bacterium]